MINIDDLIEVTKDLRLLYVEDNEDARESTLLVLDDLFDNIIVAVDGEDGLNKFKNNTIDLIITDISMPNIDGLKMSKAIKQIDYNIPIIILTALTDLSVIKEAIDIGIDSFINKPLEDIDILFNKLNQIIKKINYGRFQQELAKINQEKEKNHILFNMLNEIAHQWRQPLCVISTISSGYLYKKENNLQSENDDTEMALMVQQTTQKLSDLISKITNLNINDINIEKLQNIIQVSNPIYKES